MSEIVLSINPEYVERIIAGTKKYEFRTRVAKDNVDRIAIYCTYPIMKVIAEAEVKGILAPPPKDLWEKTKQYAGISKIKFFRYFKGRKVAYAYELGEVRVYQNPKDLIEFGCNRAPQSFACAKPRRN